MTNSVPTDRPCIFTTAVTGITKSTQTPSDLAAKATATLAAKVATAQVVGGVPTTSKYRSNLVVVGHCKCFVTCFCLSVLSHSGISL